VRQADCTAKLAKAAIGCSTDLPPQALGSQDRNWITHISDTMTERERPVVFISYSWESEPHKDWVLRLAN